TPDGGLDVALQSSCGSVRANLGPPLAEQAAKVRKLAAMAVTPPLQPLHVTGPEVSWEVFRAEETALLALLADESLPLAERLWQGLCRLTGASGPVPPAGELGAMKAEL